MAETLFTRALVQAAEFHGSTQSLASALRVPEATLLRWMVGRAQMPVRAFHQLVANLVEHERRSGLDSAPAGAAGGKVAFNIMDVRARCPGCEHAEFLAPAPVEALRMTSILQCASCARQVPHGELLCALATRSVLEPRHRRMARSSELLNRADRALEKSSVLLGSSERRLSELRGAPAQPDRFAKGEADLA